MLLGCRFGTCLDQIRALQKKDAAGPDKYTCVLHTWQICEGFARSVAEHGNMASLLDLLKYYLWHVMNIYKGKCVWGCHLCIGIVLSGSSLCCCFISQQTRQVSGQPFNLDYPMVPIEEESHCLWHCMHGHCGCLTWEPCVNVCIGWWPLTGCTEAF